MTKPYAPACDRNKDVILSLLKPLLKDHSQVFEIGSGTGQHGVYFAENMPWLTWCMSDQTEYLSGINQWVDESGLSNVQAAQQLDVNQPLWPISPPATAMFSANTFHIMSWESVKNFFTGISEYLAADGLLMVYGPFNYGGHYSSESNAAFDEWLKAQNAQSAIRDFEALDDLAKAAGLQLLQDAEMPANNRLLIWQKNR
ncbi:MAG: DUF938 domain-containing protein [Pseudomonadales bacterium]|nr:DUF938 domain-containing protein [Pseudomonadales bacterium]